jgi:hypothetical protein
MKIPSTDATTIIGFCAICERDIAVHGDALVHHGYKRPGTGFIEGDCFCVHQAPYELSCEPLKPYLIFIKSQLASSIEHLRKLEAGEVYTLSKQVWKDGSWAFEAYTFREIDSLRKRTWESLLTNAVYRVKQEISGLGREIARIEKWITEWKPAALRAREKETESRTLWVCGYQVRRTANGWAIFDGETLVRDGLHLMREAKRAAQRLPRKMAQ